MTKRLRSYFPWRMWLPSVAVVTVLSVMTTVDIYRQMHDQMVEVAQQATDVAVGQLASILTAAQELLRASEEKLKEQAPLGELASQPDRIMAALRDIEDTLHGTGFHDLAVVDRDGNVLGIAGDSALEGWNFSGHAFMEQALDGQDFVLSKPIESDALSVAIAPLAQWVRSDSGEPLFLLMTLVDVHFLQSFQLRLTSNVVKHVALLDKAGVSLVGSWPFTGENSPASVDIRRGVGSHDMVAAAGFSQREVLANVQSELILLMLTYLASIAAITALAYAYAFRAQLGDALNDLVTQKDVLHREAQHRVSGALQLISSLVALQAREDENPRVKQALDTIKHRVAAILAVNGKLSGEGDGRKIDLSAYLQSICTDLAATYEQEAPGAHLEADLSSIVCDSDRAVRLGLIVNELVTNAYRHGLADGEGSVVVVQLSREKDRFAVTVSDDGVGAPATQEDGGIGLELVSLLAEQLDCVVERQPSEKGVSWRIEGTVADLESGSD